MYQINEQLLIHNRKFIVTWLNNNICKVALSYFSILEKPTTIMHCIQSQVLYVFYWIRTRWE